MKLSPSSPFGGQTRTRMMLALNLLETSYLRELARLLEAPVSGVRKALLSLESDGLVRGRFAGRTRIVRLDPTDFAQDELKAYLSRLAEAEPELRDRVQQAAGPIAAVETSG